MGICCRCYRSSVPPTLLPSPGPGGTGRGQALGSGRSRETAWMGICCRCYRSSVPSTLLPLPGWGWRRSSGGKHRRRRPGELICTRGDERAEPADRGGGSLADRLTPGETPAVEPCRRVHGARADGTAIPAPAARADRTAPPAPAARADRTAIPAPAPRADRTAIPAPAPRVNGTAIPAPAV